jgi:multidrug efflux pump subunit AcrA (membrane-fusion protein)
MYSKRRSRRVWANTPFLFIDTREEGKIELTDEQVKAAAIGIQKATPAKIKTAAQLPGEIRFNEDRTAHVVPRLAGVVESVPANLGQTVKRGQVLAVIASTGLSEQRSELLAAQKAPFAGQIDLRAREEALGRKNLCRTRLPASPTDFKGSRNRRCQQSAKVGCARCECYGFGQSQSLRNPRTFRRHGR